MKSIHRSPNFGGRVSTPMHDGRAAACKAVLSGFDSHRCLFNRRSRIPGCVVFTLKRPARLQAQSVLGHVQECPNASVRCVDVVVHTSKTSTTGIKGEFLVSDKLMLFPAAQLALPKPVSQVCSVNGFCRRHQLWKLNGLSTRHLIWVLRVRFPSTTSWLKTNSTTRTCNASNPKAGGRRSFVGSAAARE